MSDDDARREVARLVQLAGGRTAFARKAKIDPKSLGSFLDGWRWPQDRTLTKIEQALGRPVGWITDLRREAVSADNGEDEPGSRPRPVSPETQAILDAIRAHPGLHPLIAAHLENQVEILALLLGELGGADALIEDQARRRAVAEQQRKGIQRLRAAEAVTPPRKGAKRPK